MEISNREAQRKLESLIKERDSLTPPPEERAGYILNLIKDHNNNITNWDLLCFCSEYLGSQILVYEWLNRSAIRLIAQQIQEAHYLREEVPETGIV